MAEKTNFIVTLVTGVPLMGNLMEHEELVPAVLTKELITTLKPSCLDFNNIKTLAFQYRIKVPVVFIPMKKEI